ncbi:hypothetical protein B0H13DRAFT_2332617 [Mycena leptocephala]|nr:hypothetical protein B0H13DRAFT_2332617 [Mycena leptocephala]
MCLFPESPVPCAPLALVVLLPLLRRPSSSLGLSSLHRAGSAKRERSTKTNEPIFRASAFVPHDGDGDQWRRPQLKHKPVFCRHASCRMQRVRGLDSRPPRHFPYAFAASCHISQRSRPFPALQDHMPSSRHRYVTRRVVPLRRPDASRNCAVWSRSVVVVGTRDAHERAAIIISSVRSLAGTGIEKRMYWFGDACHRAFGIAGDAHRISSILCPHLPTCMNGPSSSVPPLRSVPSTAVGTCWYVHLSLSAFPHCFLSLSLPSFPFSSRPSPPLPRALLLPTSPVLSLHLDLASRLTLMIPLLTIDTRLAGADATSRLTEFLFLL